MEGFNAPKVHIMALQQKLERAESEIEQLKNKLATMTSFRDEWEGSCDAINRLYQQSLKTNEEQAKHSAEQRKEIDILKSANEFLSKRVDDRQQEINLLEKILAAAESLLDRSDWTSCLPIEIDDLKEAIATYSQTKNEGRKAL